MSKTEAAIGRKYTDEEKAALKARYDAAVAAISETRGSDKYAPTGDTSRPASAYDPVPAGYIPRTSYVTAENGDSVYSLKMSGTPKENADKLDYYAYRHPGWAPPEALAKERAELGGPTYKPKQWPVPSAWSYTMEDGSKHRINSPDDIDTDVSLGLLTQDEGDRLKKEMFPARPDPVVVPSIPADRTVPPLQSDYTYATDGGLVSKSRYDMFPFAKTFIPGTKAHADSPTTYNVVGDYMSSDGKAIKSPSGATPSTIGAAIVTKKKAK